jgi:hypothetical protein
MEARSPGPASGLLLSGRYYMARGEVGRHKIFESQREAGIGQAETLTQNQNIMAPPQGPLPAFNIDRLSDVKKQQLSKFLAGLMVTSSPLL